MTILGATGAQENKMDLDQSDTRSRGAPDAASHERQSPPRAFEARSDELGGASGSSFYAAMRVLPLEQRKAMFAIYGFCRAVDDIADKPGHRDAKLAELARWRSYIESIFGGTYAASVESLVEPVRRF